MDIYMDMMKKQINLIMKEAGEYSAVIEIKEKAVVEQSVYLNLILLKDSHIQLTQFGTF